MFFTNAALIREGNKHAFQQYHLILATVRKEIFKVNFSLVLFLVWAVQKCDRAGGSRAEDVEVLFRSDEGHDIHRGRAQVRCFGDQAREARLRWFGQVQRRDSDCVGKRMLRFMLPERRPRGRPKRRFMDLVKDDMRVVGVSEADAEDSVRWRQVICCGDPWRE